MEKISIINFKDFYLDIDYLQNLYSQHYDNTYIWDTYLVNHLKLDFINSNVINLRKSKLSKSEVLDFYTGELSEEDLLKKLPNMNNELNVLYKKIKPFRKRLISECNIYKDSSNWKLERIKARKFSQKEANIQENIWDYRHATRVFTELPDVLFDSNLEKLIKHSAEKISLCRNVRQLNCVIHHTIIFSDNSNFATNSPENIHQDGMDFIVSAFVIERKNITGGESRIYLGKKSQPLLDITLQKGQGIFQSDLGTNLWHEVTPIRTSTEGYRSTVGLDFTVIS